MILVFLVSSLGEFHPSVVSAQKRVCPTDFNADDVTNIEDYAIFSRNFLKKSVSEKETDINEDTRVDIQDYSTFIRQFLKHCPKPTAPEGIPLTVSPTSIEPTATTSVVPTQAVTQSPTLSPSVVPTSTATPRPTAVPLSQHLPTQSDSYGQWDPSLPKYQSAGPQKYPVCTKAFHDTFKVKGPDGKWYPTWHPPVAGDPTTGLTCAFGHEHGLDPSKSALWQKVQEHFYFDTNQNSVMDPDEQSVSGLPFGYANEQLGEYFAAKNQTTTKTQEHVGYKISYANGEADTDLGSFSSDSTGGIVIPLKKTNPSNGFKWTDSGARCYYLSEYHQGSSSADAFSDNLHEVTFAASCQGPTAAYDQDVVVTVMASYGAAGEFTNLCDPQGDRKAAVLVGKTSGNSNWPGVRGRGVRNIIQRSCLNQGFFVALGSFSMNLYENWSTSLWILDQAGKPLMTGVNLSFDIADTARHFDPTKPEKVGYNMDLCYETLANGNKARGTCSATNYGQVQGITANDTRSNYKGLHRGSYYQGPTLNNANKPSVVYTDPFGANAAVQPFVGSIRQNLSAKNVDYTTLGPIDPRKIDTKANDGEGTVHVPN